MSARLPPTVTACAARLSSALSGSRAKQALEIDPFEMIAGQEPSSVWHKYTEERPPEGARVLCNLCGCAGRYGEYIYKGGKWYFPDLDDEECEANILVSSWTEVFPE